MAGNWWEQDAVVPQQRVAPTGPVPGRLVAVPKPVDPLAVNRDERAARAETRASEASARAATAAERQADQQVVTNASSIRDDFDKRPAVVAYRKVLPKYMAGLQSAPNPAGDLDLIYSYASIMDPESAVREGEQAMIAGGDTLYGRTVARLQKELGGDGAFRDEYRQQLRKELSNRMGALNRAFIDERVQFKGVADRNNINPMDIVGEHPGGSFQQAEANSLGRSVDQLDYQGKGVVGAMQPTPPRNDGGNDTPEGGGAKGYRFDNNAIGALNAYLKTPGASAEGLKAMHDQLSGGAALMTLEDAAALFKQGRIEGFDYSKIDAPVEAQARALAAEQDAKAASVGAPRTDAGTLVNEGFTFGLSGEAAGVGNALSGLTRGDTNLIPNYLVGRNARDLQIADARRNLGYTGTALEMGGGLLSGGVGLARAYAPSANIASSNMRAAVGGGGLAGFGYGQDEGSVTGAALGAGLGYGLAKATPVVGNALAGVYNRVANRPSAVAARNARAGLQAEGAALQQAGQAEGVNVNRAMVNPSLQNRVTRSGMSVFGAGTVNRSMADVASGVQAGTERLGAGGTALEPQVAGQTIQTAAERYIKQSGAVAKRQYDKAERLAGNTKVTPLEAGQRVGQLITKLQETPETNAGEIAFLQKLESDFGKDLSVGGLRRIRTQLRGKIAKGELTFGEEEANVLGIMDAASNDISNGLAAAGKTDAANAFKAADSAYRQRMSFINDTVQKLIGKRNANVTPESTLSKFQAMATPKGDEAGLGKMMAQMAPDEAADIRATLASTLGQNNKGEFSTAALASQAQKMTRAAKVHIFGQDGADSLDRLVMLAKAHNRVTSTLRGSPTGVATAANAWRTALTTVMGLGGGGAMGSMEGFAMAGATAGLIGAGDVLSARALMSTNLTKWLARTPTTSADINKHIQQLGVVASRDPAIANEVLSLQARLIESINSAPARLAADEGNPRRNVVNGRQGNGQNNGGTDQGSSRQAPPNTGAPR